jgi:hypothetical protein
MKKHSGQKARQSEAAYFPARIYSDSYKLLHRDITKAEKSTNFLATRSDGHQKMREKFHPDIRISAAQMPEKQRKFSCLAVFLPE